MTLASIDWGALAEAGYVSAIAGLAVLVIAALGVGSSLLAQDARGQDGRGGGASSAIAYSLGTLLCVAALVGIVAYGIYLLTE